MRRTFLNYVLEPLVCHLQSSFWYVYTLFWTRAPSSLSPHLCPLFWWIKKYWDISYISSFSCLIPFRAGWQQESKGKVQAVERGWAYPSQSWLVYPPIYFLIPFYWYRVGLWWLGQSIIGPTLKPDFSDRLFLPESALTWLNAQFHPHNVNESTTEQMKKRGKEARGCWSRCHCWEMCLLSLSAEVWSQQQSSVCHARNLC